ncbi:hypothetical protein [Saccharopolyspora phatthalungensis]|uniref:Uncharacterized protein n=1 Tax=Saccharopolyspora phatthalungensis TaxID=664693 RepID=A0A840QA84_9PSEU|nr:hypothetical protein [Saccharopolyspora phatthalungensis]MBB5153733.1 hypothetical protein [Saccharopolyspora phatthalungensis]
MERDPVESLLPELAEWAKKQEQPVQGNTDEAAMLLRLLNEHVGIANLGKLRPQHLNELLLEQYPRRTTMEANDHVSTVLTTIRELLDFAADTGRLSVEQVDELQEEIDAIEPWFPEAVLDWGLDHPLRQVLNAAGIDPADQEEVAVRWIEEHTVAPEAEANLDLREQLGLPDRLPPLRLPSDEDLAAAARRSPLLDRARRLATWASGRPLAAGELAPADAVAAAEELGFPVPDSVAAMGDIPELASLWALAAELEFIGPAPDAVETGPTVDEWPDGSDETVLDVWADALGVLVNEALQDDDVLLDLADSATIGMVSLFLARNEGMPVAELREVIGETAVDEFTPPGAWESWVDRRGDPAERLLSPLADLGAAQVDQGIARLTPLAQYAFGGALTDGGVEVPLLPPVEQLAAFDLLDFAKGATDDELAAETEAWFEARGADAATQELLTAAATGDAEDRMIAIAITAPRAATAPQRWREALDEPMLRPYAKLTLYQLDPSEQELEPTVTDAARLLTDMLGAALDSVESEELPDVLAEAVPPGEEATIFEEMWRLDHPDVREVLTLIGTKHPDKKIAKAARKAAFKIAPAK